MQFKQWLHEAFPFDDIQLSPDEQLRKNPEIPDYSQLGQVNFHDRYAGFTSKPIAGKMVMDRNHKLFIANEKSHERVCGVFGIDENCLSHGFYSPGGGHKIWTFHDDKKDNFFGLETVQILVRNKLAKMSDAIEFLGQNVTIGEVLSNDGREIDGVEKDEDERNKEMKNLIFWKSAQPKKYNRKNFPDTPEGRAAWFYRYQESQ